MVDTSTTTRSSVYEPLTKQIRQSIEVGRLKQGDLVGSEYELAKKAAISRMSVRRGIQILVDQGLVERRPGKGVYVRARSLGTRTVQVFVPNLRDDQSIQIVRGAQDFGISRGVQIQSYDAHNQMDLDLDMLSKLPSSEVGGAIISSWHHPRFAEHLFELKRQNYPFVLVDEQIHDIGVPSVVADNVLGGRMVGEEFLRCGHRRIAFIGTLRADTVRHRLEGLRDAISDAGVPFDRSLVIDLGIDPSGNWRDAIEQATRKVLQRSDPATGIFYSNDQVAADGYLAIKKLGLRIPQDVSVVAFDDNPLCSWLDPPLSTIRQPSFDMGKAALELLMQLITEQRNGGKLSPVEHRILPVEWVPRQSLAAPRTAG